MAKITKMLVGESLVGDGNEVAHIDLIIGPRGTPAETAFANSLTNNKDGFTALLAVVAPNLMTKPATCMFNKVTIKGAKSEERVALEKNADYFGLDLDKDHPEWILVGYNRKARGYPILMEKKSNGKTYKFTLESAKQMFKKEVA